MSVWMSCGFVFRIEPFRVELVRIRVYFRVRVYSTDRYKDDHVFWDVNTLNVGVLDTSPIDKYGRAGDSYRFIDTHIKVGQCLSRIVSWKILSAFGIHLLLSLL
ncbi:cytochrome P450 3A19 [Biomphalaria glabrata]